jgi:hypothetical protein
MPAKSVTQNPADEIVPLHNILLSPWTTKEQLGGSLKQSLLDVVQAIEAADRLSELVHFCNNVGPQLCTRRPPARVARLARFPSTWIPLPGFLAGRLIERLIRHIAIQMLPRKV